MHTQVCGGFHRNNEDPSSPQEEKQNEAMLHAKRQKIFLKVLLISLVTILLLMQMRVFV